MMNMKKILMLMALALALCSCQNYLTVQPQGYVIPSTDEEFAAILHSILKDVEGGGDQYVLGNMEVIARLEGCADDLDANIKVGSIASYAGEVINSRMTDYRETYSVIKDCNIVIDNMVGRTSEESVNMLSCATAIKGICFYNLLRDFCEAWDASSASSQTGLVLVDGFDISAQDARSSLAQTAAYTENLLRTSLKLGQTDRKYVFTEWIVKAYLARLLFWTEDWAGAASVCNDIIDHSGCSLTDAAGYEKMIQASGDPVGEVLIKSHINNASELDWYFSYLKGYIKSRPASASLVRLFGEDPSADVRYRVGFDRKRICQKNPEYRIRLSEICLMLAECKAHLGDPDGALELLNEIRRNRIDGVTDLSADNLPPVREDNRIVVDATGKALTPLMQAIFDERRRELFLEGDRWFELKRNGCPEWWIISNGLKYTTRKYLYTAPVYKADVDVYGIKQNEGYE